eukprot:COSAG01_NODE_17470_length_1149_cov_1.231429_1_plen_279_part_00
MLGQAVYYNYFAHHLITVKGSGSSLSCCLSLSSEVAAPPLALPIAIAGWLGPRRGSAVLAHVEVPRVHHRPQRRRRLLRLLGAHAPPPPPAPTPKSARTATAPTRNTPPPPPPPPPSHHTTPHHGLASPPCHTSNQNPGKIQAKPRHGEAEGGGMRMKVGDHGAAAVTPVDMRRVPHPRLRRAGTARRSPTSPLRVHTRSTDQNAQLTPPSHDMRLGGGGALVTVRAMRREEAEGRAGPGCGAPEVLTADGDQRHGSRHLAVHGQSSAAVHVRQALRR